MVALWFNQGPIRDHDSYWHIAIGREILQTRTLRGLGLQWLGVPAPPWMTSQWLSEVLMSLTVNEWGWRSLVVLRLLLLAVLLLITSLTLMRRRTSISSMIVTLLVAVVLAATVQDRPQTFSFILMALLAAACGQLLLRRGHPPAIMIALGCLLWAQLHGLWIVAPLAFGLVVSCLALEDRSLNSQEVRYGLISLGSSLAGLLNPYGISSFVLPWRFHVATGVISEWMPTTFRDIATIPWGFVVLLTIVAWARSQRAIPLSEIVWVLFWTVFGTLAFRNVVPSLLLTAPVTVVAMHRAWPPRKPLPGDSSSLEARILLGLMAAVVAGGTALVAIKTIAVDPLADTPALRISEWVALQPEPMRIFNDYNTSGSLIGFSEGKARLVVDGRADMWGGDYIDDVVGVTSLSPGWERLLEDFRPDAIVAPVTSALPQLLTREGTWRVELRDRNYELLLPVTGRQ